MTAERIFMGIKGQDRSARVRDQGYGAVGGIHLGG